MGGGLSHVPASGLLDLRLSCIFRLSLCTCSALGKAATPGLCHQQGLFTNAVVYLKGVETYANLISCCNLENLIPNGGFQLVALRALWAPTS